jgi:hypothetical protein
LTTAPKISAAVAVDSNIVMYDALTLWKGRLSLKLYVPLKAAIFGIKSY